MTLLYVSLLALASDGPPAVADPNISPAVAYALIEKQGRLENVTIVGNFDWRVCNRHRSRRPSSSSTVILDGTLVATGAPPASPLRIQGGSLNGIRLTDVHLAGELVLEDVRVEGPAQFEGAVFGGPLHTYKVTFRDTVRFNRARFQGPVEILDTTFRRPVMFNEAVFKDRARFDRSKSERDLSFDSVVFEGDAAFLKLRAAGTALFRGTQFMRDAEFRFCVFGSGDFGNDEFMSAFHGLADFRGCTMGAATFEYTEFRGNVSFVNATFAGDLSFKDAAFRGATSDLSGLRVKGRFLLPQTYFAKLVFRWSNIAGAVLGAEPKPATLAQLRTHIDATGEKAEAIELSYHLARAQMDEQLDRRDLEWTEKLKLRVERLVWGLPTGYGTKLGRIALIATSVWVLVSLSLLLLSSLRKLQFVLLAPAEEGPTALQMPDEPGAPGFYRPTLGVLLRYSMSLLFKVPSHHLRTVASPWVMRFLGFARLLGLLLLALVALTLANVEPGNPGGGRQGRAVTPFALVITGHLVQTVGASVKVRAGPSAPCQLWICQWYSPLSEVMPNWVMSSWVMVVLPVQEQIDSCPRIFAMYTRSGRSVGCRRCRPSPASRSRTN